MEFTAFGSRIKEKTIHKHKCKQEFQSFELLLSDCKCQSDLIFKCQSVLIPQPHALQSQPDQLPFQFHLLLYH
jgi:hypothetical protein